jgi:hypothetical protein
MAKTDKIPATFEELLVSSFAAADSRRSYLSKKESLPRRSFMTSSRSSTACIKLCNRYEAYRRNDPRRIIRNE